MSVKKAVEHVQKRGVLLVFPVNNRKEPDSLWSRFYPRSEMRWEWDSGGDDRVGKLWMLMKELSTDTRVVYSKWYQGRATFLSREIFPAVVRVFLDADLPPLSGTAGEILEVLEMDSPLSTKQLKKAVDLQGKFNEPTYSKAMKELFTRGLVVGFGEVDDGAFPSLAVGATKTLYEELWAEAEDMSMKEAWARLDRVMPKGSVLRRFLDRALGVPLRMGKKED